MIKKILTGITTLAVLLFCVPVSVEANPGSYATTAQTAAATTSPSYMTAGTATTTLVYDSYNQRPVAAASALLLTQFTGSSTASTLNIGFEYSNGVTGVDCAATPTACDWFKNTTMQNSNATTSAPYPASSALLDTYTWTFASTSQSGELVSGSNNRSLKAFTIPTPAARYTRITFSMALGGTNGAVWAQVVPFKENN